MEALAPKFKECGFDVIARWVFGNEEGLSDADICKLDLDDVKDAEALFIFTHPREEPQPGGGRFVEMGYAMALGKPVYVIGPRENVFCNDPKHIRYDTIDQFFEHYKIA